MHLREYIKYMQYLLCSEYEATATLFANLTLSSWEPAYGDVWRAQQSNPLKNKQCWLYDGLRLP